MKIVTRVVITITMLLLPTLAQSQSPIAGNAVELEQTTELAKQGNISAQSALGEMYYFGNGVSRDGKSAIEWFSKAAAQGDATSQFYLGAINYNGRYVPRNFEKAFNWFSMAAAQGHRNAKTNLGVMYLQGEGVPKNPKNAFEIFSATAELGDKTAQIYLAGLYFFGDGIPANIVLAYMWATISDQIDLKDMKGNYMAASVSRAALIRAKMTSEQLAEARKLINDWLSMHPRSPDSGFR